MGCLSLAPCRWSGHVCPLHQSVMTFSQLRLYLKGRKMEEGRQGYFLLISPLFFNPSVGWVGDRKDWASWEVDVWQAVWVIRKEGVISRTPCRNFLPGQHKLMFRRIFREPHFPPNTFKQLPSLKKPIVNNWF